jgi:hypothetical protein
MIMGIGDWGLGIGGLGIGDWAQSPIPNPQSPIPNPHYHPYSFLCILIKSKNIYLIKNIIKNEKIRKIQ